MNRHELQQKAEYYMERITAEEQALSLQGLTEKSRKEVEFIHRIDCQELKKIIEELDNVS